MTTITTLKAIEQLKEYNQWICWGNNTVDSAGKMNKQPFPYGCTQTTDPTNPELWASYEDCVEWQAKRKLRGLGFAFTTDTGIMGIDFDNCVVNNVIDPEVMKIVTHLDSYTEFSPSGNGIHVLIYGAKPKDFTTSKVKLNNGLMMEVYDGKRYFTVTGNHVSGTPDAIHEAHSELADVIDKYRNTDKARSMYQAITRDVQPVKDEYHPTWLERFMENKVASAVNKIGNAVDGNRHDTRRAEARAVGGYYQSCVSNGYRGMSEQDIIDRLYDALPPSRGNEQKELRTIEWGFECGLKSPIDLPAMKEKEKPLTTTKSRPTPKKEVEYVTAPEATEEVAEDDSIEISEDWKILVDGMYSEVAVSELFVIKAGDNIKYDTASGQRAIWYIWNGKFWEIDKSSSVVTTKIKELIFWIRDESMKYLTEKEHNRFIRPMLTHSFMSHVASLIKMHPRMVVISSEFNMQHDYLPVKNGIYHFPTRTLKPHTKEMMFSTIIDINYVPNAPHPFLDKFLKRVCVYKDKFTTDYSLIEYVQQMSGLVVTGRTDPQALFFLHGKGANGKTAFKINVLDRVTGGFHVTVDSSMIEGNGGSNSSTNTEVASIKGCRYIECNETNRGARLNSSLIKNVVDGSIISSAEKFQAKETFKSIGKFVILGNHRMNFIGEDEGVLRRWNEIPFYADIPLPEQMIPEKMKAEFDKEEEGILFWVLEGSYKLYSNDLKLPICPAVTTANQDVRTNSDPLIAFIDECCFVDNTKSLGLWTKKELLWQVWQVWAKSNNFGSAVLNRQWFGSEMRERFGVGKKGGMYNLNVQMNLEYIRTLLKFGELPYKAPYHLIDNVISDTSGIDIDTDDNNEPEPTPPTTPSETREEPAKVIAPEEVQSSLSINPSTLIDASSLQGKMLALIQVNHQGMYAGDIADLVGYSGKTERIMDDLFGLVDKGIVEKVNTLWLLKK